MRSPRYGTPPGSCSPALKDFVRRWSSRLVVSTTHNSGDLGPGSSSMAFSIRSPLERRLGYFNDQQHVVGLGVQSASALFTAFDDGQVRVGAEVGSQMDELTGSVPCSCSRAPVMEPVVEQLDGDALCSLLMGGIGFDFSLYQLDPVIGPEDSGLDHLAVLLAGDPVRAWRFPGCSLPLRGGSCLQRGHF